MICVASCTLSLSSIVKTHLFKNKYEKELVQHIIKLKKFFKEKSNSRPQFNVNEFLIFGSEQVGQEKSVCFAYLL